MARIVVLAHRVPFPPNKGEKLRTFHQIEELIKEGHELQVLAPCESDADISNSQALSTHFNIDVTVEHSPAKFIRLLSALVLNKSFSEQNFYQSDLRDKFHKAIENADAVLLTASSLIHYLPTFSGKPQPKLLMDFMDVDSDKWKQYAQQASFLSAFVYAREAKKVAALEVKALNRCDTCFVISEQEENLLKQQCGEESRVSVLGNGIDQSLFFPVSEKPIEHINLLFSGVMDYKPNIDAVLWFVEHCWESVKLNIPNARLIVAGMNPSSDILKLTQDSSIEVTGFVEDIKPYFDQAHIFVAPFRIARGVQNKVLQAMACALPVVTTTLGAEGIKCKADKDVLIAQFEDEFSEAVIRLSKQADLRTKIGEHALKTINSHYAWSCVLAPLTSLLRSNETHS